MRDATLAILSLVFLVIVFGVSVCLLFRTRTTPKGVQREEGAVRRLLSPEEERQLQIRLLKQADRARREREEAQRRSAVEMANPSAYNEKRRMREEERQAREDAQVKEQKAKDRVAAEEYARWKSKISVADQGGDTIPSCSIENLITYIWAQKCVDLNETAARFSLRVEQLILRIHDLERQKLIYGIFDDRARYLLLNDRDVASVNAFLSQLQTRVPVADLSKEMKIQTAPPVATNPH